MMSAHGPEPTVTDLEARLASLLAVQKAAAERLVAEARKLVRCSDSKKIRLDDTKRLPGKKACLQEPGANGSSHAQGNGNGVHPPSNGTNGTHGPDGKDQP